MTRQRARVLLAILVFLLAMLGVYLVSQDSEYVSTPPGEYEKAWEHGE